LAKKIYTETPQVKIQKGIIFENVEEGRSLYDNDNDNDDEDEETEIDVEYRL